jgi:hypothetical protein
VGRDDLEFLFERHGRDAVTQAVPFRRGLAAASAVPLRFVGAFPRAAFDMHPPTVLRSRGGQAIFIEPAISVINCVDFSRW